MRGVRALVIAAAPAVFACGAGDRPGLPDAGLGAPRDGGPAGDDGASGVDAAPAADADPAAGTRYAQAHFASTHNSYSGDIDGARGSMLAQLESGARNLELDLHAGEFSTYGYRVGHNSPGGEVDRGGENPESDSFEAWLEVIASWSDANPRHAPITLVVDLKTNIGQRKSYDDGEPANLNDVLMRAFGDRLLRADEVDGELPTIPELRGRVLAVMSGSESSRLAYRRDRGNNEAVAVNASGHVVEVHDAGGGLWYWTGEIVGESVRWHRHGEYDTGRNPAVALSDDGLIVEVHNAPSGSDHTLFYRVGELDDDFEIVWYHDGGLRFPGSDSGANPTVRFVDRGGLTVREVHQSETSGDHFYWDGVVDPAEGVIEWTRGDDGGETSDPLYDKRYDETEGYAIELSTGAYGPYEDALLYRLGAADWRPIRYPQVLFVEAQHGGSAELEADELTFYAASAESESGRSWGEQKREQAGVVRLWNFNSPDYATRTPVNFPATDTPYADWYKRLCADLPCRE